MVLVEEDVDQLTYLLLNSVVEDDADGEAHHVFIQGEL